MENEVNLKGSAIVKDTVVANNESTVLKNEVVTSSQLNSDMEAIKKKATMLFLQGKRSVFIRDYHGAIADLSESCQLFNQVYPEQHEALADLYFYYGKALLEVGRSESDILGDQMKDEDEENEEDEEDEDDTEQNEVETYTEKNESNKNGVDSSENRPDSVINSTLPKQSVNDVNKESDGDNEDINDLQLSWEYLELAKLIYSKKAETCKESAIKLAETYLCLGENGLESENYVMAIDDIKQALDLQRKYLKEEDRRIAETLYQLGLAHSLDKNYDEAMESFKKAIEQLEKKVSSLEMRQKMGDKKTEDEERDAFYTMDGEVKEIKEVIKDLQDKIKDMMECKNQVKAELLKQVCSDGLASSSSASDSAISSSSSNIPATNISHLVRKKRKNDDEELLQEKKPKTDE